MTPFPTQEPDAGATNMPNPNPSANSSGQDGSGGLRTEMAAVAHEPSRCLLGADPVERVSSPFQAVELAVTALFNAGYRRVSVDDDTVERVAEALRRVDRDQRYDQLEEVFGPDATGCGGARTPEPCGGCIDCHSAMVANDLYSGSYCAFVQSMARAAVQALRDGSGHA